MTVVQSPTRVLAVGDPGETIQQIQAALSGQSEFELADVLTKSEKLVLEVRAVEPDILLIGHVSDGSSIFDLVDELALQVPETAIVAILPEEDPTRAQQIILAGARAFLVQPFTQVNLLSTLRRVRDLEARRKQVEKAGGRVEEEVAPLRTIAVHSPRGGVGCSTTAVNLAVALTERTGERVLLIDGKLNFGHVDVLLNIRAKSSIADLLPHAGALDDGLFQDVIVEHASGLHVLLAPDNIQVSQGIRPEGLYNVMLAVQRRYDYIVIDAGSALTENTVTFMDLADRILLVTTPDMASLRDVSRFVQISRSLAYPPDKLLFLLNRSDMPGGVKSKDIESALHHPLFMEIPDDEANVQRSLNRGIPLIVRYPRSPATRAFQKVTNMLVDLKQAEESGTAQAGRTVKGKRLSRLFATQSG